MKSFKTKKLDFSSVELSKVMTKDRHYFQRECRELSKRADESRYDRLLKKVDASKETYQQRLASVPNIKFPEALPIIGHLDEIRDAISKHQVVVIAGETGSGKTTQLPKICLSLGIGVGGLIGHTQPRRLAARSVAERIAEEVNSPLGQAVGYKVRFDDSLSAETYIKLMTDGILLAEIQRDRYLRQYDAIIIDEAHERSLNIDFLLGYLKQLLPKRPDLKVIVTSATIDHHRFAEFFNDSAVMSIPGKMFPVSVHYSNTESDRDPTDEVVSAIEDIVAGNYDDGAVSGDALVFLNGEREIREVAVALRRRQLRHTEVLPLYARLSYKDQRRIFQSHSGFRVILSTNVAETSLTVPNIRYVVDAGLARVSRYSYKTKVQRLPVEPISQASANQRKGRSGRIAEGVCIRLYTEEDFNSRPEYTEPEIQRTNLAAVILQMRNLGLGDIEQFPFVDPPDVRFVRDGYKTLHELAAADEKGELTPLGKKIARFPIDPKLARMLLAGADNGCLSELLLITSMLSIQDPREIPFEKRGEAKGKHEEFSHPESDFLFWVKLWFVFEEQRQALTQNQLRKYCKQYFLSFSRMREWRETHHQLIRICQEMKLPLNKISVVTTEPENKNLNKKNKKEEFDYQGIHSSILTGVLGHVLQYDEDAYITTRGRRLSLFPTSVLAKKKVKWAVAAELIETQKLYGAMAAKVFPEWVEKAAQHLVQRQYSEPHWDLSRQCVSAFEKVSLYGLVLAANRKVHYGPVESGVCREILIREGIVARQINLKSEFYQYNILVQDEIAELENKSRRKDILVDDQVLYHFYNERLPEKLYTLKQLEQWLKQAAPDQLSALKVNKEALLKRDASHVSENLFPDKLTYQGLSFPLEYHFEPGAEDDGVTVIVPKALLGHLSEERLQWLVPGLLRDKCIALLKLLPKKVRKNFVPIPDYVDACLAVINHETGFLLDALSKELRRMTGVTLTSDDWQQDTLDAHFLMNIKVVNATGKQVNKGRDLAAMLSGADLKDVAEDEQIDVKSDFEKDGLTDWSVDDIPKVMERDYQGMTLTLYPAFSDQKDSVSLLVYDSQAEAEEAMYKGLVRLYAFLSDKLLVGMEKKIKPLALLYQHLGPEKQLWIEVKDAAVALTFLDAEGKRDLVWNKKLFEERFNEKKSDLILNLDRVVEVSKTALTLSRKVNAVLTKKFPLAWAHAHGDIKQQLSLLVHTGFIRETPWESLQYFDRYLNAILIRLDKLSGGLQKDKELTQQLRSFYDKYELKISAQSAKTSKQSLEHFFWMLEEYRVSLFAQQLKTAYPISEKRLKEYWQGLL